VDILSTSLKMDQIRGRSFVLTIELEAEVSDGEKRKFEPSSFDFLGGYPSGKGYISRGGSQEQVFRGTIPSKKYTKIHNLRSEVENKCDGGSVEERIPDKRNIGRSIIGLEFLFKPHPWMDLK